MSDSDYSEIYSQLKKADADIEYVNSMKDAMQMTEMIHAIPNHYRQDIKMPAGWSLPVFFVKLLDKSMLLSFPQTCQGDDSKCAAKCPLKTPEDYRFKKCPVELYYLSNVFDGLIREFDIDPRNTSELQLIRQIAIAAVISFRAELSISEDNLVEDIAGIIQPGQNWDSEVLYHKVSDPQFNIINVAAKLSQQCTDMLLKRRSLRAKAAIEERKIGLQERDVLVAERRQKMLEERDIIDGSVDPIHEIQRILTTSKQELRNQ